MEVETEWWKAYWETTPGFGQAKRQLDLSRKWSKYILGPEKSEIKMLEGARSKGHGPLKYQLFQMGVVVDNVYRLGQKEEITAGHLIGIRSQKVDLTRKGSF